MDGLPFLWLNGADGVGKTSVAWAIFTQLISDGVPTALVDFDDLGNCRPNLPDDPYNHRLKAANLGVMWQNFSSVGSRCLVASGVVSTREVVRMHAEAVPGCELTLCRLRVGPGELRKRYVGRARALGVATDGAVTGMSLGSLAPRVDEAMRYGDELDRDDIADFCVDTDGRSIPDVARLVLAGADGWPPG